MSENSRTDFLKHFQDILKDKESIKSVRFDLNITKSSIKFINFMIEHSENFFNTLSLNIQSNYNNYEVDILEIPKIVEITNDIFYIHGVYYEDKKLIFKNECSQFLKNVLKILFYYNLIKTKNCKSKESYYNSIDCSVELIPRESFVLSNNCSKYLCACIFGR